MLQVRHLCHSSMTPLWSVVKRLIVAQSWGTPDMTQIRPVAAVTGVWEASVPHDWEQMGRCRLLTNLVWHTSQVRTNPRDSLVSRSRSRDVRPPHMPNGSLLVRASSRHCSTTGQLMQMVRASSESERRCSSGKNTRLSAPVQAACCRQVMSAARVLVRLAVGRRHCRAFSVQRCGAGPGHTPSLLVGPSSIRRIRVVVLAGRLVVVLVVRGCVPIVVRQVHKHRGGVWCVVRES